MGWIRVATLTAIPEGTVLPVEVAGRTLVLCHDQGTIHALEGSCPHRNGPMGQAQLVDGRLICPWHAWEFRCSDGCYDYNPEIALSKYPVRVLNGVVFVDA